MQKVAHFFDLNCLLNIDRKAWIVDKSNPNKPIYKISQSEFKLIKSGVYSKKGNRMDFNGATYFLSDTLWNRLKVIALKSNLDISNLAISLQEYLNKDVVDELKYEFNLGPMMNLKNEMCDIYILCSKYTKSTYDKVISELQDELLKNGISIKDFYYINENFLNQNSDSIQYKQFRLLLQHSCGYRSDGDKFTDTEISKYTTLNFYDKYIPFTNIQNTLRHLLDIMLSKSDKGLRDVIKEDLSEETPVLIFHQVEDNLYNPTKTQKIDLDLKFLIKKFESFRTSL